MQGFAHDAHIHPEKRGKAVLEQLGLPLMEHADEELGAQLARSEHFGDQLLSG